MKSSMDAVDGAGATSLPNSDPDPDMDWRADWQGEQLIPLNTGAEATAAVGAGIADQPSSPVREASASGTPRSGQRLILLTNVYARLSKGNPYIGFFHYAPGAGNRSRRTYFEQDIISNEVIRRQHEVRSNPMIGNFHYGVDLYGQSFEDFQAILAQLRARDVEREVQDVLNRHIRPFGGNLSPGSAAAISVRRQRGRARSITDSDAPSTKPMVRSRSAGKAAIMRVAAAEAAAAEAAATAVDVGVSTPTGLSAAFAEGAAIAPEKNGAGKGESWSASAGMEAAREALEDDMDGGGMRSRRVSSAVREQVQRSLDVDYEPETEEPEVEGAECLEEEQRKQLRARAFAIVVYASGDSLVKLVEKERRTGASPKRFKYAGAIDMSKCYPKSGSLDDCALLRPIVAERSRLYNDLIAEVNGFRRHFFLRQKIDPKEAYRQARRRQDAVSSRALNQPEGDQYQYVDDPNFPGWNLPLSRSESFANEAWLAGSSYSSANGEFMSGGGGAGGGGWPGGGMIVNGNGYDGGGEGGYMDSAWGGMQRMPSDDGVPPFHTLVGPGQFARQERWSDEGKPGDAWVPGTVSALRTKESWRSKQEMRDFHAFKPFFVQAKTDFNATYRLLEECKLGEGSYACVFLAEHLKRMEDVAVKAVQKRLLFSEMEKKSVRAEIDNQLRIVHKHVVRLYEVYETPDNVLLVLENCPCGDLEKMLYMRGRLTEIEAKRVTMQLLEGVSYLHTKGIVHCDIKPQNLLFSPDPASPDAQSEKGATDAVGDGDPSNEGAGNAAASESGQQHRGKEQVSSPAGRLAKLCDFGISCKVPDVRFYKQTGDINKIPWSGLFGTGGYIAPEIMNQQPFGKPADLWSVGVMLYQMISGRLPFIPARVCVTKPVAFPTAVWSQVDDDLKDIICGLLEKDPSQRLTAVQALQHPWIQTIHHLRPSFPHFVPKQGSTSSAAGNGEG